LLPSGYFLAPAFAGVSFLVFALVLWALGHRRRSLAFRWASLGFVAWALDAGFAVVASLANPPMFGFWSGPELATLFLGVCMFVVALVYGAREALRGSRVQR
jgi:hypothetical protein